MKFIRNRYIIESVKKDLGALMKITLEEWSKLPSIKLNRESDDLLDRFYEFIDDGCKIRNSDVYYKEENGYGSISTIGNRCYRFTITSGVRGGITNIINNFIYKAFEFIKNKRFEADGFEVKVGVNSDRSIDMYLISDKQSNDDKIKSTSNRLFTKFDIIDLKFATEIVFVHNHNNLYLCIPMNSLTTRGINIITIKLILDKETEIYPIYYKMTEPTPIIRESQINSPNFLVVKLLK